MVLPSGMHVRWPDMALSGMARMYRGSKVMHVKPQWHAQWSDMYMALGASACAGPMVCIVVVTVVCSVASHGAGCPSMTLYIIVYMPNGMHVVDTVVCPVASHGAGCPSMYRPGDPLYATWCPATCMVHHSGRCGGLTWSCLTWHVCALACKQSGLVVERPWQAPSLHDHGSYDREMYTQS